MSPDPDALRLMGLWPVWRLRTAAAEDEAAQPATEVRPTRIAPETPKASAPAPSPLRPPVPATTRPLTGQVVATDWDGLRAQVMACSLCPLAAGRMHAVFGTGRADADLLVVGEAPGAEEDMRGLPFVGRSGQLLDRMLAAIGEARGERAFIANIIKCRPPGNRNPLPEEVSHCAPYLVRQVELLSPRAILALGRFAMQFLLHADEPVGRLRGRVHLYGNIPVVATYHPAYLLRNPAEKARAWQDLCLLRQVLGNSRSAAGTVDSARQQGLDKVH